MSAAKLWISLFVVNLQNSILKWITQDVHFPHFHWMPVYQGRHMWNDLPTPEDKHAQPLKITRYIALLPTQQNIPGANTGSADTSKTHNSCSYSHFRLTSPTHPPPPFWHNDQLTTSGFAVRYQSPGFFSQKYSGLP